MVDPTAPADTRETLRRAFGAFRNRDLASCRVHLDAAASSADPVLRPFLLRVAALAAAASKDWPRTEEALSLAAQLEREAGMSLGAQHSIHALSLVINLGGSPTKLRSYYSATLEQTKRQGNVEGAGLCLRSLGELALFAASPSAAAGALAQSADLLVRNGLPEADAIRQAAAFIESLDS